LHEVKIVEFLLKKVFTASPANAIATNNIANPTNTKNVFINTPSYYFKTDALVTSGLTDYCHPLFLIKIEKPATLTCFIHKFSS
jgi:hypothetical protein